jgi:hypothetical protein
MTTSAKPAELSLLRSLGLMREPARPLELRMLRWLHSKFGRKKEFPRERSRLQMPSDYGGTRQHSETI